jgi:hypothetical protein
MKNLTPLKKIHLGEIKIFYFYELNKINPKTTSMSFITNCLNRFLYAKKQTPMGNWSPNK